MRAIFGPEHEAMLVMDFFAGKTGYFVDVGANDPQIGSQTWGLEQEGWTGILIEPQPHLVDRLMRERTSKVYSVACSSPANSGREMSLHVAGPMSSLSQGWARSDSAIDVPVRTLDEVLMEAQAPTPIDFLSIDVEGHGFEVLHGANLRRWMPRLILIEDHVTNLHIHRHLRSHGYRWLKRTGLNSWYIPDENAPSISAIGRIQFIRKYYLGTPFRNTRDMLRRARAWATTA